MIGLCSHDTDNNDELRLLLRRWQRIWQQKLRQKRRRQRRFCAVADTLRLLQDSNNIELSFYGWSSSDFQDREGRQRWRFMSATPAKGTIVTAAKAMAKFVRCYGRSLLRYLLSLLSRQHPYHCGSAYIVLSLRPPTSYVVHAPCHRRDCVLSADGNDGDDGIGIRWSYFWSDHDASVPRKRIEWRR